MRRRNVQRIALGGVLASVAMVIMCLGGFIPFATFICPMLCTVTGYIVLHCCGMRIAWTWYAAVGILVLLFAPDKEAAAVYAALGSYACLKHPFERIKLSWIVKLIYFNSVVGILYALLIYIFGMSELLQESMELGYIGVVIMAVLGNIVFFLLDKLLTILRWKL